MAGEAGEQEAVVELALLEGGLDAELTLVAHLETRGGVGVRRKTLVLKKHGALPLGEGVDFLLAEVAQGEIDAAIGRDLGGQIVVSGVVVGRRVGQA